LLDHTKSDFVFDTTIRNTYRRQKQASCRNLRAHFIRPSHDCSILAWDIAECDDWVYDQQRFMGACLNLLKQLAAFIHGAKNPIFNAPKLRVIISEEKFCSSPSVSEHGTAAVLDVLECLREPSSAPVEGEPHLAEWT
jgi:hypothetical protein